MTPDEFKHIVNNPHFIPGIFNYCDRWCERCRFTERCSVYATSEAAGVGEGRNTTMKASIKHTAEIFKLSLQMLEEQLQKEGINLHEVREQVRAEPAIPAPPHAPYCRAAKKYITFVNRWFDGRRDTFHLKGLALAKAAELGLPDTDPVADVARLRDAIDVIRWYQHLIYIKLRRASRSDDFDDDQDSQASAKIALIGLDNSIAAWHALAALLPNRQAEIQKTTASLDRLRKSVETALPQARAFLRPGFDDLPKRP